MTSVQRADLPVLCLEDDPTLSYALRRTMASREVDCVERADACRERLRHRRYGAMFLDIRVPDGSGLEVLAWARARGDTTHALVMTGDVTGELANRAQELGAEYVQKPFGRGNVEAFLQRCDATPRTEPGDVAAFAALHRLPPREAELIDAVWRGVPRATLPAQLGISPNTLKTNVRRLLHRTSYGSLDELLRAMLRGRAGASARRSGKA